MHFCSKFGNCNFNWWGVMARSNSKWGKFWRWSSIWHWRSQSIVPQNKRDLNQGLLHLWPKFGDPSWNGWCVIARTSSWLTHGRTHTHRQTQATTIPEGQNWSWVIKKNSISSFRAVPCTGMWSTCFDCIHLGTTHDIRLTFHLRINNTTKHYKAKM